MAASVTIQGELRLPLAFLQAYDMAEIERRLQGYGLLPVEARERRWRMDAETPGACVLQYTCVVVALPEE